MPALKIVIRDPHIRMRELSRLRYFADDEDEKGRRIMLQAFREFVSDLTGGGKAQSRFEENDYRLAAAALLMHSATIDGGMSDIERDKLKNLIMVRFTLDESAAEGLMVAATEAEHRAVDLYHFTSLLNRSLDEPGRQQIIEMMWQIALVDGQVTEFEDNLIWRAADLLCVPSRVRIELRRRVAEGGGQSRG